MATLTESYLDSSTVTTMDVKNSVYRFGGVLTQFIEDMTTCRYYVDSGTHNKQFVGRVPICMRDLEERLSDLEFKRNPLASLKRSESDYDNFEEGSWRKVGFEDHPKMQLHVILYDSNAIDNRDDDMTYVYAHWEYRWDVHPIRHFRGKNASGPEGVRRMKKLFDENGINCKSVRP